MAAIATTVDAAEAALRDRPRPRFHPLTVHKRTIAQRELRRWAAPAPTLATVGG